MNNWNFPRTYATSRNINNPLTDGTDGMYLVWTVIFPNFKELRKCSVPCRSSQSSVAAGKWKALPEACRRAVPVFCWDRGGCLPAGSRTNGSGHSLTADALVLHYEGSETKTSCLSQLCYGHHTPVWRIGGKRLLFIKALSPPARRIILAVKCILKKRGKAKNPVCINQGSWVYFMEALRVLI